MQERQAPLLAVEGLSISFAQYTRGLRRRTISAVRDLSLTVQAGEMVAIVGASGSGKSLLAHSLLGILPYNATEQGSIYFGGQLLTQRRREALRGKEIVLVPQSVSYLDPLMRVGPQVQGGGEEKRAREALARYGLDAEVWRMYPFALSGGMARRALIATAAMALPHLIIADEPTPGLHMSVARRVLSHFREMADAGAGVLLITHDLRLAVETADRIVVLYEGAAVEEASARAFESAASLRHPYSRALWHAMPEHGFSAPAWQEGEDWYGA